MWATTASQDAVRRALVAAPTAGEVVAAGGWPAKPVWNPPPRVAFSAGVDAVRRPLLAGTMAPRALAGAAAALLAIAGVVGVQAGGDDRAVMAAAATALVAEEPDPIGPHHVVAPATTAAPAPVAAPVAAPAPVASPAPAPAPAAAPAPAPVEASRSLAGARRGGRKVLSGPYGTDISYPQCDATVLPSVKHFAIIGITGGRPRTQNPCLAQQWRWAMSHGAASGYINVAYRPGSDHAASYAHGRDTAIIGIQYALSQGVDTPMIWLDVEQLNTWSEDKTLNAEVLRGAIDGVRGAGLNVGIYSTNFQYGKIAGSYRPGVPVWYAIGESDGSRAPEKCDSSKWGFTGGPVWLVQYVWMGFDRNITCAPIVPESDRAFRMR